MANELRNESILEIGDKITSFRVSSVKDILAMSLLFEIDCPVLLLHLF